ncbi:MAG TPA: peroxiredoxin family protein [Methanocellaceae archaeon]
MYGMEYKIDVGEMAPDFSLPATNGKTIRLYDCKNKKTVLLFFFDHHSEPCQERLSKLADNYDQFKDAGVAILPVSILRVDEGRKLAECLSLPFPIVCDENHAAVEDYRMGECSTESSHVCFVTVTKVVRPTMLVIDTSGIIRYKGLLDASGAEPDNATLLRECRIV